MISMVHSVHAVARSVLVVRKFANFLYHVLRYVNDVEASS